MPIERARELELRLELYRTGPPLNLLAFDDKRVGLRCELFVPSATEVLDRIAAAVLGENPERFRIRFDSKPFQGWQAKAVKTKPPLLKNASLRNISAWLGRDAEVFEKQEKYKVAAGAGTWYRITEVRMPRTRESVGKVFWLCAATSYYFPDSPAELFLKVAGQRRGNKSRRGRPRDCSTSATGD